MILVEVVGVVGVLLTVLILEGVRQPAETTRPDLVGPISVVLFALTVCLIRRAGHRSCDPCPSWLARVG